MQLKLPAPHNRVDGEGNVGHWVAWPDEVEEKEAKWLARAFRAKNNAFSSEEIWKGIFSFRTAADVKRRADLLAKTPGIEWNRIFGQKITVPSAREMLPTRKRKESKK